MRTTTKTLYFSFFIIALLYINTSLWAQGMITATYAAEIPTSYDAYDASCTGSSTAFSFSLPAGDNYTVTGIDISYSMTALSTGFKDEQRSQVHCQNTNMTEGVVSGVGASTGTYSYTRNAVKIATFVFDNSAGNPNSGGNIYIGAEDTDPGGVLYYGFDFDPHPIVIEGSQTTLLPIELLSFTATKSGQTDALLEWSTAVEKNADHFELERNMEGSRLWEKAGQVAAVGESNTPQKYSFLDQNIPLHKTRKNTASYRLKMVDMDGAYKYSNIESVLFNPKTVTITTYPNPTSDFINIKWHAISSTNEIATLEIFDLSGKLMLSKQITVNTAIQENIGDFPSGTYQLFVHHNRDLYSDQFVKVK